LRLATSRDCLAVSLKHASFIFIFIYVFVLLKLQINTQCVFVDHLVGIW